jgi:hypothetical protein
MVDAFCNLQPAAASAGVTWIRPVCCYVVISDFLMCSVYAFPAPSERSFWLYILFQSLVADGNWFWHLLWATCLHFVLDVHGQNFLCIYEHHGCAKGNLSKENRFFSELFLHLPIMLD